ncbi:hypothetical protein [Levilactobacillus yonginensis]
MDKNSYNAGKAVTLACFYDEDHHNGHRDILLDADFNAIGIGAD